jgi:HNH endonuclease/NUMOD4 motif
MEKWRVIEEAPSYLVSNHGKIKNRNTGRILRPGLAGAGYSFVNLSNNGSRRNYYVHRLVGKAFVVNDFGNPEINHLDGDKTNNHYWNLEWVTSSYNSQHASRIGLIKTKPIRIIQTGEVFIV